MLRMSDRAGGKVSRVRVAPPDELDGFQFAQCSLDPIAFSFAGFLFRIEVRCLLELRLKSVRSWEILE